MRLSTQQLNTIVTTSPTVAGEDTLVWLYGSRLDDTRHCGIFWSKIRAQWKIHLFPWSEPRPNYWNSYNESNIVFIFSAQLVPEAQNAWGSSPQSQCSANLQCPQHAEGKAQPDSL